MSGWGFDQWIRALEVAILALGIVAQIYVVVTVATHVVIPRATGRLVGWGWKLPVGPWRIPLPMRAGKQKWVAGHYLKNITAAEVRIHGGRAWRAVAFICFEAAAINTLVERFAHSLTVRSVLYMLGALAMFRAWFRLDFRRWKL